MEVGTFGTSSFVQNRQIKPKKKDFPLDRVLVDSAGILGLGGLRFRDLGVNGTRIGWLLFFIL